MKNELLRFQDTSFVTKDQKYGPFFFQIFEGELMGIFTDEFFDKECLVDFFCGKVQSMKGFFYLRENLVPADEQIKVIKKINSEWLAVISGRCRLFEALSIVENIFFPRFIIKTNKHNKIVQELFCFFQLDIPLNKRVNQLSVLERIEIELLHAIVCNRKVIIISDINKFLNAQEIICLNRIYKHMIQMGFTICLIESLTDVTMEMLNYYSLVKQGKTVGGGYRGEYLFDEAYRLLNMPIRTEEYQNLLRKKETRFYNDENMKVLEWNCVTGKNFQDVSFSLRRGEILEIVCQKHSGYVEMKNILTGSSNAISGEILFCGENVSAQSLKMSLKKWRIGYVDTSVNMLFANRSVIENICYPLSLKIPFFYMHRKYFKAARDYISDIVGEIDLHAEVLSLTAEQVIWVSICKWLLCKPQLLLFFVPAVSGIDNLDIVIEKLFIELGIHGISVLLVTEQHEVESEIIDNEIIV